MFGRRADRWHSVAKLVSDCAVRTNGAGILVSGFENFTMKTSLSTVTMVDINKI